MEAAAINVYGFDNNSLVFCRRRCYTTNMIKIDWTKFKINHMFFGWWLAPHDDGNDGVYYVWQSSKWLTLKLIPLKREGKRLPSWYVNLVSPIGKRFGA